MAAEGGWHKGGQAGTGETVGMWRVEGAGVRM